MPLELAGRIAFLADIHGNAVCLEKMIRKLRSFAPDAWCVLGDTVGYFPAGNDVLDLLRGMNCLCLRGNHEEMLLAGDVSHKDEYYRLSAQRAAIHPEHLRWIGTWPRELTFRRGSVDMLCVHGSPADPLHGCVYPDDDMEKYRQSTYDWLFTAHTHRPLYRPLQGVRMCNPGSAGLPRDGSGNTSAIVFDSARMTVSFVQCPVDVAELKAAYGGRAHPEIFNRMER